MSHQNGQPETPGATRRLTVAQALIEFLVQQRAEHDGERHPFFAGCFGIFGHGNLAGIGQALQQQPRLRYYQGRNEQAMVHAAVAYAKHKDRLQAFACTASVGPGATNMITGAATATINRIPVLLLPGDVFATRRVNPVLQQLESPHSGDISVNDAFRPVSRYWDRINRPEQLVSAALEAMRVLTDPAETGAVTLCLPQDVQAEAFDWPEEFFAERVWLMDPPRHSFDTRGIWDAIGRAERPVIVAGGGVLYGRADGRLRDAVDITGLPVVETQAGKGALPFDHPCNLGAAGATGTSAANAALGEADLVIGLGTRYDDFTTASRTAFANPDVRFLNVNVNAHDARKLGGQAVVADVRDFLEMLLVEDTDQDVHVTRAWGERIASLRAEWDAELARVIQVHPERALPGQAEVIGVVNAAALAAEAAGRGATVLGAAGSLPGDLHKLWRTRDRKGYHLEYGYSCMGYEVAGGLGVALADPEREVFVMVGDGSWLMMSSEIVTAVQEGVRFTGGRADPQRRWRPRDAA